MTDPVALARAWLAGDPDPYTRAELEALVNANDIETLADRMAGTLRFGTAGIRGVVEAGSARMNRATVIRTTAGLASYLIDRHGGPPAAPIVVGFDARLSSTSFADDTIGVLTAAGFTVRFFPEPTPTPLVAFAGRVLGAAASIVITASHNPPRDNGYKVYDANAAQIIPPVDLDIAASIDAVGRASDVPRDAGALDGRVAAATVMDPTMFDRYWAAIDEERPRVYGTSLRIVSTPMHGVGGAPLVDVLTRAGYNDVHPVPEQFAPDGNFPTVSFPNPEEPGALDLAEALATELSADLVIANDPDADRLAVSIPSDDGWQALTGNQIGILLADHVLRHWSHDDQPLVLNSIVSSPALGDIAEAYGAGFDQTLTGFKWICNASFDLEAEGNRRFAMGYEEALGYSIGPVVRDKDGISAALVFVDMVAEAKAQGRTVHDLLEDLAGRFGLWVSAQHSIVRPGAEGGTEIADAMERLSRERPSALAGPRVVGATDYRHGAADRPRWLAATALVALELEGGGRVLIRPSGTEPKLKIYVDLKAEVDPSIPFPTQSAELTDKARDIGAAMAEWLGMD